MLMTEVDWDSELRNADAGSLSVKCSEASIGSLKELMIFLMERISQATENSHDAARIGLYLDMLLAGTCVDLPF